MAEREFKVLITGDPSSLVGASKESAQALGKVEEAGSGVAKNFSDQLNPAMVSFQKDWRGTAEATESWASRGELKKMVRELAHEFPLLGSAARIALNPIAGGFTALIGILGGLKHIFDSIIEASSTGIFSGSFRQNLDEARKAALESELAFRAYERSIVAVGQAHSGAAQKSRDEIDALREQQVAVLALTNAKEAAEIARVNMMEKQKRIGQDEAARMRLDIQDRYARLKLEEEVEAKEAELAAKRKEQKRLEREAGFEEINAGRARAEMDEAQGRYAQFKAFQAATDEALKKTKEQIKALDELHFGTPDTFRQKASARNLEQQLMARKEWFKLTETDYADAAAQAKERFQNSATRSKEMADQAAGLGLQIPGEQARANQQYINSANVAAQERLQRTYAAAGEMSEKADQTLDGIEKNIRSGSMVLEKTVTVLEQQQKGSDALNARVEALERQLKVGARPKQ